MKFNTSATFRHYVKFLSISICMHHSLAPTSTIRIDFRIDSQLTWILFIRRFIFATHRSSDTFQVLSMHENKFTTTTIIAQENVYICSNSSSSVRSFFSSFRPRMNVLVKLYSFTVCSSIHRERESKAKSRQAGNLPIVFPLEFLFFLRKFLYVCIWIGDCIALYIETRDFMHDFLELFVITLTSLTVYLKILRVNPKKCNNIILCVIFSLVFFVFSCYSLAFLRAMI